jgi:hypothetical protein
MDGSEALAAVHSRGGRKARMMALPNWSRSIRFLAILSKLSRLSVQPGPSSRVKPRLSAKPSSWSAPAARARECLRRPA